LLIANEFLFPYSTEGDSKEVSFVKYHCNFHNLTIFLTKNLIGKNTTSGIHQGFCVGCKARSSTWRCF
jgi:hypothetical protein